MPSGDKLTHIKHIVYIIIVPIYRNKININTIDLFVNNKGNLVDYFFGPKKKRT